MPQDDKKLSDEEVAFRLVSLYFEQIAHLGFKRKLDVDAIINAYFYTLNRLKHKDEELSHIEKIIEDIDKEE
jgi:hypothetical protein